MLAETIENLLISMSVGMFTLIAPLIEINLAELIISRIQKVKKKFRAIQALLVLVFLVSFSSFSLFGALNLSL